jgi:hypothetical protein
MKTPLELYRLIQLQQPFRVMGRDLVPFTLGHAVAMDRLGIGTVAEPEDLLMAVLFCSMPVATFERKARSIWFSLSTFYWSWKWGRRWKKEPERLAASLAVFAEYLDVQTSCPDFELILRGEEIEGGAPHAQHLRTILLAKLNYRPETVMETPFAVAHWDYLTWLEAERAIRMLDGQRGETIAARFADADARHEDRIKKAQEFMAQEQARRARAEAEQSAPGTGEDRN